jgi:peptide/nickel transport system substrate-binding protein
MKKLLLVPLFLLLAAVLLFVSCGGEVTTTATATATVTATAQPTKPAEPYGTLRVSMPSFSYESMDAIEGESFFGEAYSDPLIVWDENFDFAPSIAESWTVSEDGLTWTFNIRQGVKFHNGDPLTSADVQFSVEHWNPCSPYLSYNYDTQYCPDDHTYVYKTIKPEHPLAICFSDVRIYPKNYIETNGWDVWKKHPIASGPWKFLSFTSGYNCVMEANTEHWRGSPHFETLIQYVVPEEATQIAMLKRGEVDIITGITLDKTVELLEEGWNSQPAMTPTGVVLCMPGTFFDTNKPTQDINIRHALAYAIDYDELCETFFHGLAVPGGRWFMHPGSWGWDDSWQPEVYDLAMAESLLAEAGYPDAFEDPVIPIWVQVGSGYTPDLMQVLQGYWTAAGIQTQINMVDPFEWAGMFFVPHYDEPEAPNVGAIFPWVFPDAWPSNVYHSYNMYCGGVHTCGNDPHAIELYERAVNEPDASLVEGYWSDFMSYAQDEMFVTFGVCLIYVPTIEGPEIGDWGWGEWVTIGDAYAGIQHAD